MHLLKPLICDIAGVSLDGEQSQYACMALCCSKQASFFRVLISPLQVNRYLDELEAFLKLPDNLAVPSHPR